jgi:hypothetical protein
MDKEAIRHLVLRALSDADVRTDQCDIVRVYWRGRFAGVRESEDESIEVMVELRVRDGHPDFLSGPAIACTAYSDEEAAEELVFWLRRVEETNIDSYPEEPER